MMRRSCGALVSALVLIATAAFACSSSSPTGDAPTPQGADGSTPPSETPDATTPSDEPKGPPAIGFVGRFDATDPNAPKAGWPGARIIARFDGTSLSAKLDEPLEDDQEGPSEWDVIVDGKADKKIVLQHGTHDYELAKDLAAGVHVVELYKRSEAQNGVTSFLGFDFGPQGKLLAPPTRPARKIEIIGDSAASAFGSEGVGLGPDCPGEDWGAKYQNFRHSFGAVLGETFKADVHGTVFSGKGFARNIWRPDKETLGKLYPRSNPNDSESTYDLTKWIPDVIVIMAGGNDFAIGQPNDDGPASLDEFTTAYSDLVGTLRTAYPQAHVFLVVSGSITDDEPAGRETRTNVKNGIAAVIADRANKGDTRVYSAEPPVAQTSELTGCNGHGNPEYHIRIAADLAAPIRQKAGW